MDSLPALNGLQIPRNRKNENGFYVDKSIQSITLY